MSPVITVIELVNLTKRYAMTNKGVQLPITNFFGADGEEVEDPIEAVVCVAGDDDFGWVTFKLEGFQPVKMN